MIKYAPEQREMIANDAAGKTIEKMTWEESDGGYWVVQFADGSETCIVFKAELI